MELTHEEVAQILKLIESSDVEYLDLELGDVHIVVGRNGPPPAAVVPAAPAAPAPAASESPATPAPQIAPPAAAAPPPQVPPAEQPTDTEGTIEVRAPMVGVFYRTPEPGAEPFIELGDKVVEGATLGLIEVMKVFNGVKSDVSGTLTKILVENEQFVEYDQPLFLITPDS